MKLKNFYLDMGFDGNNVTYQGTIVAEVSGNQQLQTIGLSYNNQTLPFDDMPHLLALCTAFQNKLLAQAKKDLQVQ